MDCTLKHVARRASECAYSFVGPRLTCAFCDEAAECTDHTMPAALISGRVDLQQRYRFFVVSACLDCNARAGWTVDRTFIARRRRIAASVRKANRRLLNTPEWSDAELADLGPNIRSAVRSAQWERAALLRRIAVLESLVVPDGVPDELAEPVDSDVPAFWTAWREPEFDGKAIRSPVG